MFFSDSEKSKLMSDPAYIDTLYGNEWQKFAKQMGAEDANGDLSDPLLACAFASVAAYDLKPYGNEAPGVVSLDGLLAEPSLACDDYVRLTLSLMQEMPETASVDVTAVGWADGAVGDHAQLFVSDGNETLLLDPTIGLIVRHTSYDDIIGGVPTTDFVSFFNKQPKPDPWQMNEFNSEVIHAVKDGQYMPADAIYSYTSLHDFNTSNQDLSDAEMAFSQALINSGALSSQTRFESVLSFISENTSLFESAAAAVADQPAMQNEANVAVQTDQKPLMLALNTPSISEPVGREANLVAAAFGTGSGTANLVGTVLTLGGLAAAYDNLTGDHTVQNLENSLTPGRLAAFCNAVS